jgi:hypothetical protein
VSCLPNSTDRVTAQPLWAARFPMAISKSGESRLGQGAPCSEWKAQRCGKMERALFVGNRASRF